MVKALKSNRNKVAMCRGRIDSPNLDFLAEAERRVHEEPYSFTVNKSIAFYLRTPTRNTAQFICMDGARRVTLAGLHSLNFTLSRLTFSSKTKNLPL